MNELIANALEHAFSPGGRDERLAIVIGQDGAQVTVTITDNGRGLPADFNLDSTRGLGLRIARTLAVKDLAGTLDLENRREGGTQATLTYKSVSTSRGLGSRTCRAIFTRHVGVDPWTPFES